MMRQHSRGMLVSVALILLQLLLPFAILAALCIAWAVRAMWAVWQQETAGAFDLPLLGRQLDLIAYSVLGYYYPALVQASLSVFSCLTIDHPIPPGLPYQSAAQVGGCFCAAIGYMLCATCMCCIFMASMLSKVCVKMMVHAK